MAAGFRRLMCPSPLMAPPDMSTGPSAPEEQSGADTPIPVSMGIVEAIKEGRKSLITFGQLFLPNTFRQESPLVHYDLSDLLFSAARYVAIALFRDGAKTTLLRAYTLLRIAYGLSNTIMFVSASQEHSKTTLRWVRKQIESNPRIRAAFGLTPGSKWTDELLEILRPDGVSVSLLAVGITGQVRGFNIDDYRPDLIVCDDIQTEENVGTIEQRRKTKDLFFNALGNSLAPATESPLAKLVLINTPYDAEDVIETCLRDPLWQGRRFSIFDASGKSVWEKRYPTRQLLIEKSAAIRRGDFSGWMREKECTIVKSEFATFDVGNLKLWTELPKVRHGVITAIDPASSESTKADQNVVLTAIRSGPDVYVAAYVAARGQMPDKVAADFFSHVFLYRPTKLRVEGVAYQRVLKWYLDQEMLKRRVFVAADLVQDRRKKSDRIIQALVGLVSHGHLFVHESMHELIEQMRTYSPDKDALDDILDALSMAVDGLASPFAESGVLEVPFSVMVEQDRENFGDVSFRRAP